MQRVAIARALVNDPDILLADEPTGALDSETSIQIMELVKEIAKDRLVIMVTHNPELAEKYSTRIVKLLDGQIVGDSDPFDPAKEPAHSEVRKSEVTKGQKTSMSFLTALSLSKNNLMTKKGRTFLTSFAGSIGIIGIALILSLSNGVQEYINSVERSTLASFPVSIQHETVDYTSLMTSMMNVRDNAEENRDPDRIYTNDISTEMMKTMLSEMQTNNLAEFKEYLESDPDGISASIEEIQYSYDSNLYIYGHSADGDIMQINPSTVMSAMMGQSMADNVSQMTNTYSSLMGSSSMSSYDAFRELLSTDMLKTEYEVLAGRLPEAYNEVVVLVTDRNELSDVTLYTLGLRDQGELEGMMSSVMAGESFDLDTGDLSFSYDDLMGMEFSMLTAPEFYQKNDDGTWTDMRSDSEFMEQAAENGKQVSVLVELKARFDEENNIVWARKLEKAGCHVIYGLVGLKTHSKITLVVRKEEDGIRRYVHLGTGNYNDATAKLYTDIGMMTASEAIGEDATAVFNMLSGYSEPRSWNRLSLAPLWLKDRFLYLIEREKKNAEAGREGHIIAKMNSLCDRDIIVALYEASRAGVRIELIVRGICCLKVGIPGVSENISVRSIVGNFLEHARVFYFENNGNPEFYCSSADWMPRNLERRVEILFPVEAPALKEKLWHILEGQLRDNKKAHILKPDGSYEKVDGRGKEPYCAQEVFCKEAQEMSVKKEYRDTRVFIPETHVEME